MFHCCATEIRLDEAQVTISINAIKNVKKPEEVEVNKISCTAATCDVNKTNIVMQEYSALWILRVTLPLRPCKMKSA